MGERRGEFLQLSSQRTSSRARAGWCAPLRCAGFRAWTAAARGRAPFSLLGCIDTYHFFQGRPRVMLLPPLRAPESLGEHSETMQKLMFAPRTVSAHPPPAPTGLAFEPCVKNAVLMTRLP